MYQLLVHISNQEPIKVDVDELPNPDDTNLTVRNPRDKGDREISWVEEGVTMIIIPWWRINYIQILPREDDQPDFPMPFRDD